jgi:GNAT superfamily N-acetyltransferase
VEVAVTAQGNFQDLKIRQATRNDIVALTELHCSCFRPEDHVPMMLGRDYVRATYRWLVTGRHSYCLAADVGGKIVGLVAVCDGPFARPMFLACLPEFMKSLLRSPGLLLQKSLWVRLFRRSDGPPARQRILDLASVAQMTIGAVHADCRGRGVFPALVEAVESCSRDRGSRAVRAGIYKTNQSSRRVFMKRGWIETPELETEDTVFYVFHIHPAHLVPPPRSG